VRAAWEDGEAERCEARDRVRELAGRGEVDDVIKGALRGHGGKRACDPTSQPLLEG
jgi:hypothetical protein